MSQEQRYLFFVKDNNFPESKYTPSKLPLGVKYNYYKPRLWSIAPKGLKWKYPFPLYWVLAYLSFFKNDYYTILTIYHDRCLIHYTCLIPPFFQTPFMNDQDLQVGPIWTSKQFRRKGLAKFGISSMTSQYSQNIRKFWYIVRKENKPSIKLIDKLGFEYYGEGVKKNGLFGISALGKFIVQDK